MRITRLRVEHLRRHEKLDLELARGLTVMRGPNKSGNFSTPAARITGVASRNEKRAASSCDSPLRSPADMATPERLMPGSRARICPAPMNSARPKPSAASRPSLAPT